SAQNARSHRSSGGVSAAQPRTVISTSRWASTERHPKSTTTLSGRVLPDGTVAELTRPRSVQPTGAKSGTAETSAATETGVPFIVDSSAFSRIRPGPVAQRMGLRTRHRTDPRSIRVGDPHFDQPPRLTPRVPEDRGATRRQLRVRGSGVGHLQPQLHSLRVRGTVTSPGQLQEATAEEEHRPP